VVVHLHGGGLKIQVLDRSKLMNFLNMRIYGSARPHAIALSPMLCQNFASLAPGDRIHVVANPVDPAFLCPDERIRLKFTRTHPLKIVFLSNLLPGKGFLELAYAYKKVAIQFPGRLLLTMIGRTDDERIAQSFRQLSEDRPSFDFIEGLTGIDRVPYLADGHVFCLPTYYLYEGQPISILEAYASGCVVITTRWAGIPDIFTHKVNGFEVKPQSVDSIAHVLSHLANVPDPELLCSIAMRNARLARQEYSLDRFTSEMDRVLDATAFHG
jgi:glycosyltransferase involved in cell wall biosynthesis